MLLPRRQKVALWLIVASGGLYVPPSSKAELHRALVLTIMCSVCVVSILRLKSLLVFSVSKDPPCEWLTLDTLPSPAVRDADSFP
jgi:hypothetical protein